MDKSGIVASIDIGTSKVCTIIAEMSGGAISQVRGVNVVPSHGIQKAIVLNIGEAAKAIRESVAGLEYDTGLKVKSAYIGISGQHIKSFSNWATVSINRRDHLVTNKIIKKAIESTKRIGLPEDRKIIHAIPRHYILDGQTGIKNLEGMYGFRLDVETHIITAGLSFVLNLIKCVQQAGIDVMGLVSEPVADSEAVLQPGEKEAGVGLADMGCGTTDITVFKGGDIWHTSALPVAGYQVTRDLALGLSIPFEAAEELKKRYGSLKPGNREETVDLGAGRVVAYEDLSHIIGARIEEIFNMILLDISQTQQELDEPLTLPGLVLCGGTANLPGIEVLGQQVLRCPVRVMSPVVVSQPFEFLNDPAYATGLGLLLWGARHEEKKPPPLEKLLRGFLSQLTRLRLPWPPIRMRLGRRLRL